MTTMKKFALLTAAMVLGTAGNAMAFDYQYIGGALTNADWATIAYWKPLNGGSSYPQSGDKAIFDRGETVSFATNVPTALTEIRVNHASEDVRLQPGSTATLTVPTVTVSAGILRFDTNQQTSISSSIAVSGSASLIVDAAMANTGTISLANTADMSVNAALTNSGTITLANTATMSVNAASSNSGAITVPSGTTFSVNAALSNSAAMSITGIFDAVADVTNSSNPTLTINSGGVVKFRSGADLLGTATLVNNGEFYAIDGQTELDSNIAISTTCNGEFRVDFVSSGSPQLKLNASYTTHSFTVRLLDTSSLINVVGTVSTSGNFISPYTPVCNGKTGAGTFSWSSGTCF